MVFLMQEFCQIIMFFKLQIALHDVPWTNVPFGFQTVAHL
jgi:hypothetical protein